MRTVLKQAGVAKTGAIVLICTVNVTVNGTDRQNKFTVNGGYRYNKAACFQEWVLGLNLKSCGIKHMQREVLAVLQHTLLVFKVTLELN